MRERIVVQVEYLVSKEKAREHMIKMGDYVPYKQTTSLNFMKFSDEVKRILFKFYYINQDGFKIEIEEKEREAYAKLEQVEIEPFPIEIENEKEKNKMIEDVSWFLRMKEKHGETFREQKDDNTFYEPHLYLQYYLSPAFKKQELMENRNLLGSYVTAEIPLCHIHEAQLGMLYHLGYDTGVDKSKNREYILVNTRTYDIEHVHPSHGYITKENVNNFISNIYFKMREEEQNAEQKETKEESEKIEKQQWIESYGSSRLQRAFALQYNCQRLYVEERTKQEFPNWNLDFDNKLSVKDRPIPSEKALDIEEEMREHHHNIDIRVHWKKEGANGKEVVVIRNYLGKYTLFQEV